VTKKTLYILRHAKAEAGSPVQEDHDRVLNERGLQAATAMGNYLARRKMHPSHVLCSTAQRTRQTLQQLHLQPAPVITYNEKLYLASAGEILQLLSEQPEDAASIMVVGHNPGFHQLSLKLAKTGNDIMMENLYLKFPTCALAVIECEAPWADIVHARGKLVEFTTPKMLALSDSD
jgi:phosphohistidine phosphatase